jgi:hypothetical protein
MESWGIHTNDATAFAVEEMRERQRLMRAEELGLEWIYESYWDNRDRLGEQYATRNWGDEDEYGYADFAMDGYGW